MTAALSKNWKYAAVPAVFIAFLAIYPQISLWITRGSAWNGSYAVSNYDEVAYSAYINALIEGKPRKYDAYLAEAASHESLYSVQLIPAYSISLPARILGLNVSATFIVLALFLAVFSSLAIFAFLRNVTGDPMIASAGVLIICCLGTAVAIQGELKYFIDERILVDFLPFLRRYQPGFAFPIFFAYCWSLWRSITADTRRDGLVFALVGGFIFAVLVFSYFFLWTTAAAWTTCLYLLIFVLDRERIKNIFIGALCIGAIGLAALVPYFVLLSERSGNVDAIQLLTRTRLPFFTSPSLILGVIVAIATAFYGRRNDMFRAPKVMLTLAFALTPIILFNQQIVTGHSLQPVHYELFIANYLALTALVLLISMFYSNIESSIGRGNRRVFLLLGLLAAVWGLVEATGSTNRASSYAYIHDIATPAIRKIENMAAVNAADRSKQIVFANNYTVSDYIPTVGNLRPLWTSHTTSGGGIDIAENKRLFHCFLYYSGFTEKDVSQALHAKTFEVMAAIFGSERALPELGENIAPISPAEIDEEVRLYGLFVNTFDRNRASNPSLAFLIFPVGEEPDFTNLDRWYQRDTGTINGSFMVYRVELRP